MPFRAFLVFLLTLFSAAATVASAREGAFPTSVRDNSVDTPGSPEPSTLADQAKAVLLGVASDEAGWIKVHAADVLVALGYTDFARRVFTGSQPLSGEPPPHRIGIMRTWAQAASTAGERSSWVNAIEQVFLDPTAPDRLQAIETLAKLRHPLSDPARAAAQQLALTGGEAETPLADWALARSGEAAATSRLVEKLSSTDPIARLRAAYALRWLQPGQTTIRDAVARTSQTEPSDATSYAYVVAAALTLNPDHDRAPEWQAALEQILEHGEPHARYEAAQALMLRYDPEDLPRVVPLLEHPHGDVRLGAAWTILHVSDR